MYDPKKKKFVRNPKEKEHRLLFILLAKIVQLLCMRVVIKPALHEAQDLLLRYCSLHQDCFPQRNIVNNQHFAVKHLVGKT
jgi:hypothetical protein